MKIAKYVKLSPFISFYNIKEDSFEIIIKSA